MGNDNETNTKVETRTKHSCYLGGKEWVEAPYTIVPDGLILLFIQKGLTTTEACGLMMLIDLPPAKHGSSTRWISVREIARRLGKSKSQGQRVLNGIQSKGFAKKVVAPKSNPRHSDIYDLAPTFALMRQNPPSKLNSDSEDMDAVVAESVEIFDEEKLSSPEPSPKVAETTEIDYDFENRTWKPLIRSALRIYPQENKSNAVLTSLAKVARMRGMDKETAIRFARACAQKAALYHDLLDEGKGWTSTQTIEAFLQSNWEKWLDTYRPKKASSGLYQEWMADIQDGIDQVDLNHQNYVNGVIDG
jgi:predicted transcriptional regulator